MLLTFKTVLLDLSHSLVGSGSSLNSGVLAHNSMCSGILLFVANIHIGPYMSLLLLELEREGLIF